MVEKNIFFHRVDTVLSFSSSRWNWDTPTPSPADECAPPLVPGGGAHSLVGGGGGGMEGPISDAGTYTVVLYVYMYFVASSICIASEG
jgi:hypothetical protein